MGILGGLINVVANFIDFMSGLIPGFNVDTSQLGGSVKFMNNLLSKVNTIFPVDTVGQVLGLVIGIYLTLLAFYFIQRAINLLRGAG